MKITFKLLLFLAAIFIAPMILPGPGGRPVMHPGDWVPRDTISKLGDLLNRAANKASFEAIGVNDTDSGTIYQWIDENGVVHYGDAPEPGASPVELSGPGKQTQSTREATP